MIDLCPLCIAVIYDPKIPTRSAIGTHWNELYFGDGEKIMNGTLYIEYNVGNGYVSLPLKAVTTISGTRYCAMHSIYVRDLA